MSKYSGSDGTYSTTSAGLNSEMIIDLNKSLDSQEMQKKLQN